MDTNTTNTTKPSKTVLVIDDEEPQRLLLRLTLRRAGYNVLEAINGAEGVQIACDAKPDIVVSDYNMPAMNGVEVWQTLRQSPSTQHLPFILMSALIHDERSISLTHPDIFELSKQPNVYVMAKSASMKRLLELVEQCSEVVRERV